MNAANLDVPMKMVAVGFLVIAWMVCDVLHIQDQTLFIMLGSLIGAVPLWHAANNLPFSIKPATPN